MKSIKNHLSLVIALVSILFSIQIFTIVERSVDAYKNNLANNYSIVVVSQNTMDNNAFFEINKLISSVSELTPDSVIQRLNSEMNAKNIELLKLSLPKFYKISLAHYPTPQEIEELKKDLLKNKSITKVEAFSHTHDTTYKLLLMFKSVISIFAVSTFLVTILLIFKELSIWQFKHSERMSIMALFGAPVWLRSAVLFRLAIGDALIASILVFILFSYLESNTWILQQFTYIGINVIIFNHFNDFLLLSGVAVLLSIFLATFIVIGHKEEA
jgi:cell division transport system permease protein